MWVSILMWQARTSEHTPLHLHHSSQFVPGLGWDGGGQEVAVTILVPQEVSDQVRA